MFTRLADWETEVGKILCSIDMIEPDLCDLSAVCNVTIDSCKEVKGQGHPPTSSCLDAALAAYRHQSSILGDVHRYCRLHVFDADLDLLIVTPRIKILFIDLVQVDKLSLQLSNDTKGSSVCLSSRHLLLTDKDISS